MYEVREDIKLIAKLQCKGGIIKIHRDYIINYVDNVVTVMDIRVVSRKEFFDNLGDPIVPESKYRWNAVDIDVEVYGDKHITHAMTLMQERMIGLETITFMPQRLEDQEEGVRIILSSQNKLEVYFISYYNPDLKITLISSFNFNTSGDDKKGKIVATPCHVLRVHQEYSMTVIDIYPLRKYFSNPFEQEMCRINEFRMGDTTTDLPCMSKIHLPGITDLIVLNHKVVVVRRIQKEVFEGPDEYYNEVFVMEPLIVRLCQEIKNDMERTLKEMKEHEESFGIQIAISYKTYYELTVILEGYLHDIYHFTRRNNNNWTDLYWRDVMHDEAMVVKDTLQRLYSIIAEELLDSQSGELAAYYFSKANTPFSYVVDRFIVCEQKSCINLYFNELFFNKKNEEGAVTMSTEYAKVFRLLERDVEKVIEIAIQPSFQDYSKELKSIQELGKKRQIIKGIIAQKRKGTKEQDDAYFLESCCAYAEYIIQLKEQPEEAEKIDIFKELNSRGSRSHEFEVINKYKSILFDTRNNELVKQPIVEIIETKRPLLLIAIMENDLILCQRYIDSNPKSDLVKLFAYEQLYKSKHVYAEELFEMYLKYTSTEMEYSTNQELDKRFKLIFERNFNETNTTIPKWIPESIITNLYIKKVLSLLTKEIDMKHGEIPTTSSQLQFIHMYSTRKVQCDEFVNFMYQNYRSEILGYVIESQDDQNALEKIAIQALKYETSLRNDIFDVISTHLSIKSFCKIAAHDPSLDLSVYLRKCIGNSFYNKHLIGLCDAFPKD